jgi:hypothetical protein
MMSLNKLRWRTYPGMEVSILSIVLHHVPDSRESVTALIVRTCLRLRVASSADLGEFRAKLGKYRRANSNTDPRARSNSVIGNRPRKSSPSSNRRDVT